MDLENIKILAVDDNKDNLTVYKALLLEAFNNVIIHTAMSGKEAINKVKEISPDVVLLDVKMPEMDGFEVCRILKSDETTMQIPIVFITAYDEKKAKIKALEVGGDAFLAKPIDEAELNAQIKAMLKLKAAEDKIRTEKDRLSELVKQRTQELEKELSERKLKEAELQKTVEILKNSRSATLNILFDLQSEVDKHNESREKLDKSEKLRKLTGEMAKIGGWEFDAITFEGSWSEEVAKIHDLAFEASLSAKDTLGFYVDSSKEKIEKAISDAITYGIPYELELEMITAKGNRKWVRTIGEPIIKDGKTVRLQGTFQDITDAKKAKDEYKEIYDQMLAVAEHSHNAICIIKEDGRMLWVNNAAVKLSEFSKEEIYKCDSFMDFVAPESKAMVMENYEKFLKGEEFVDKFIFYFVCKSGEKKLVEIFIAVYLDKNKNRRMAVNILDISEQRAATEALMRSELQFRTLAQFAPVGIFTTNEEGITTYVNPKWCEIAQLAPEDATGDNWIKAVHPEDREKLLKDWKILSHSKLASSKEYRFLRKDGSIAWVFGKAEPQIDEEGNNYGYVGVIIDITENKEAQQKINKSEKHFRSIWESTESGMRLTDADGKIVDVNNAFCNMVEMKKEDLLNKPLSVIYRENIQERILKAAIRKFKNREVEKVFEKELLLWNNKNIWFEVSNSFIEIENQPALLLGIFADISDRKQAQKELKESNEFSNYLLSSIPFGIDIVDQEGNIVFCNEMFYKLFGYGVIGSKCWKVFCDTDEQCQNCPLKRMDNNISSLIVERLDVKKNRLYEISHTGIFYKGEKVILEIYNDISDKKKLITEITEAKNKAEEMNRLKSNFLANMNHELRTPLNGIMGFASILFDELQEEEYIQMAESIIDSSKRLSETLNLLLELSTVESDKILMDTKVMEVNEIVKGVAKSLYSDALKKHLKLEVISDYDLIYAKLDDYYFPHAIHNLIDNAIKYTYEGEIKVVIGVDNDSEVSYFYISVIDTGIGIPSDKINLIWEEFRQVSEGLNRNYEGTGLGLTIVKKIVKLLDGKIEVESEVGKGSKFTVRLPKIIEFPVPEVVKDEIAMKDSEKIEKKIGRDKLPLVLYVEDDRINQNVLRLFLKNSYNVELADDGYSALEKVKDKQYDLIFMDINLGSGMNGMEVTKEIRKMISYSTTPIVAITAYTSDADRLQFIEAGCSHYLAKPFLREHLINLINSI